MADEPIQQETVPPQAEVPAATAAPAAGETVAPAPAAEAPAAPAAAEAPLPTAAPTLIEEVAQPPEPVVEAKPAEPEKPAEAPAAETPPAEKPAEAPPAEKLAEGEKPAEAAAEAPKPEEVKAPEAPVLEPVEYKYTLPEHFQMNDAQKGETHAAFDAFRADPTNPQPLIDAHIKAMEDYALQTSRDQHQIFADTRKGWRTEIMADPIMGGAGFQTSMAAVARVRDAFVSDHATGTPEFQSDLKAFNDMCHVTGVGDHPIMLRMMHRMARFIDEPAIPTVTDTKPAPDAGRRPGANPLHDNPRSHRNGAQ